MGFWSERGVLALCLASLVLGACGSEAPSPCEGAGSSLTPAASLEDWKSYADHVAVVRVVEVVSPLVFRVDRIVWSAPDAPPLPARIGESALTWQASSGDRFLIPLVWRDDLSLWRSLSGCSALRLGHNDVVKEGGEDAIRRQFQGRPLDEVEKALISQQPHPLARRYRHLRPIKRVRAVRRAGGFD